LLLGGPEQIALASTFKGWAFVAVTSVLLYALLARRSGPRDGGGTGADAGALAPPERPILPFVLLAVAILALAGAALVRSLDRHRDTESLRLQAIADIKSDQLADWLAERSADADFARTSGYYAELCRHWQRDGDAASGEQLKTRLGHFVRNRRFGSVSILDSEGRRLWGGEGAPLEIAPILREAAIQAGQDGEVRRVGPYRGLAGSVRLDFVAPLTGAGPAPAIVVLHADPNAQTFRGLHRWPESSASAESLLVRRDGDQVLFLNDLRHRPDAAARLRLPLSTPGLVAAMALQGEAPPEAAFAGLDYRGVPVLAVARPILLTEWQLIVKIDRAEVDRRALRDGVWIALAALLALFAGGAGLHLLRQREQLALAAEAQRSQAERLRARSLIEAIADGSEDAIYAKDLEGRYLLINRAAARIAGRAPHESLGLDDRALFAPEEAERFAETDRRVVAEGGAIALEELVQTPEGPRTFLTTKAPLRDESGRIVGVFGITRDIDERRRFEDALREREARYRSVVDNLKEVVFQTDAQGLWTFLSPAWTEILGFAVEESLGRSFLDTVHPDDRARNLALFEPLIRREKDHCRHEIRYLHQAGGSRWIEVFARLTLDEGGAIVGTSGTLSDVTLRRVAEESLRESEEKLRGVTDAAQDAIVLIDDRARVVLWNPAAERIFGWRAADALGQKLHELIAPAGHREAFAAAFPAFQGTGMGSAVGTVTELTALRQDGQEIPVELALSALKLRGTWHGLGLLRDISARRLAEEQLRRQAAELKGRNLELARFNRAMVGREIEMIELKRQVNGLALRLGEAPPYDLQPFERPPAGGAT
jgi:PAS domain S-box-containing protein